jgi:hypothetical protein
VSERERESLRVINEGEANVVQGVKRERERECDRVREEGRGNGEPKRLWGQMERERKRVGE